MSDETTGQALRAEIGYAVRTAAAHGYAKGKHGAPHEGAIDTLIAQALARALPIVEAEVSKAKVEAWDEGFGDAVTADGIDHYLHATREIDRNPYRKEPIR